MNVRKRMLTIMLCICTVVVMTPFVALDQNTAYGYSIYESTSMEYDQVNSLPTLDDLLHGNKYALLESQKSDTPCYFCGNSNIYYPANQYTRSARAAGDKSSLTTDVQSETGLTFEPVMRYDRNGNWLHYVKFRLPNGKYLEKFSIKPYIRTTTDPSEATVWEMEMENGLVYFHQVYSSTWTYAATYFAWGAGDIVDFETGKKFSDVNYMDWLSIKDGLWYHQTHFYLMKKVQDTNIKSITINYGDGDHVYTQAVNGARNFKLPCWVGSNQLITVKITPVKTRTTVQSVYSCYGPATLTGSSSMKITLLSGDNFFRAFNYTFTKDDHYYNYDAGLVTIKEPTCTEPGLKAYKCYNYDKCGSYVGQQTIPALGHDWSAWTSDNADTHSRTCANGGEKETKAHTWNEGTITKIASFTEQGEKTYKCTACGETKKEVIPMLDENTAPSLTASIGTTSWTTFSGTPGTALAYATGSEPVINIAASDDGSGIASVEYLIADAAFSSTGSLPTLGWSPVTLDSGAGTVAINGIGTKYVYLRATDVSGNVKYVSVSPLVVYGQSTLSKASDEFNSENQVDMSVAMNLNGNTLSSIKNGESTLNEGTDYTVNGNIVTINKNYMQQKFAPMAGGQGQGVPDSFDLTFNFEPPALIAGNATLDTAKFTVINHKHKFTYTSNNAYTHTGVCSCGMTITTDHNWDDGVVVSPATYYTTGSMKYTCKDCDETKTEIIPVLADDLSPLANITLGSNIWNAWRTDNLERVDLASPDSVVINVADYGIGLQSARYLVTDTLYTDTSKLPTKGWVDIMIKNPSIQPTSPSSIDPGKGTASSLAGAMSESANSTGTATVALTAGSAQYIYVKAIDGNENVTCVNSDRIVVAGNPVIIDNGDNNNNTDDNGSNVDNPDNNNTDNGGTVDKPDNNNTDNGGTDINDTSNNSNSNSGTSKNSATNAKSSTNKTPNTGDSNDMIPWLVLIGLAGGAIVIANKKRDE